MSRTPHYQRWRDMMLRCYKTSRWDYKYYGGRGITVCPEWHDAAVFCKWIDEHLGSPPEGFTLDRIDPDRGYEPANVRWASKADQLRNRRDRSSP